MKTLILIILFAIGINCQAQLPRYPTVAFGETMGINDVPEFKDVKKRISQLEASRSIQLSVLDVIFKRMSSRLDSLGKRITELERLNNSDPDSLSDPSIYPFDRIPKLLPGIMIEREYFDPKDTISWFDYYDCLIPPKDKEVRVWRNGKANVWFHGVDSITFK